MANIKQIGQSSDKWARRAQVAGPDYQAGVQQPRRDWAEAAAGAENNYKLGVTQAANAGRFGSGVRSAGTERWRRKALAVGPNRFAEGVAVAKPDWEDGFRPYQETIAAVSLPARGPKGAPQNVQRVAAIATALRKVKEAASK